MKAIYTSAALCLALAGTAFGVPQSDGSYYLETFTNYPEHPLSQAINVGAVVDNGAVRITTVPENEGVFRASPLTLGDEYVVEFDWTLHAPSGDNFYMFYAQGPESPWASAIGLRTISTPSDWILQVDHGTDPFYEQSGPLSYNQLYHVTIHVKPGPTKPVDFYLDGLLFGTYASRNPSLTTDLIQWGDPSSAVGFGDATVDNISVGLPDSGPNGDYNSDGFVDAADYVVWRKNNISGASGYQVWRASFGNPSVGSGLAASVVPEPASLVLLMIAAAYCRFHRLNVFRKG